MLSEFKKLNLTSLYIKNIIKDDRLILFSALFGVAILYLGLVWKVTGNIDQFTTDSIYWGAILWLLWNKENSLRYRGDLLSSFAGWLLLGLIIAKAINLFEFESIFLSFLPVLTLFPLLLIASGFKGLIQHIRELFFALFLFFPTGAIGFFLDNHFKITIINAKIATYFLYYLGFDTASSGNEVILSLPEIGTFKAIVGLPCAGIPMILLVIKLALLLISCIDTSEKQKILLPAFSFILGFLLGVVRVCLLTLLIPYRTQFNYWHGVQGSQIFSTLAITIFSVFCYWILQNDRTTRDRFKLKEDK